MKKYLALILAIVMSLSLVACGGGGGGTESPSGGGETQSGGQTASGGDIYVLVPNADHGWTGAVLTYAQQKAEEVNAEGNYNVIVQAATDAKNQQEQIDDLLAAATPPAGIVILPYDNTMESSMNNIAATDIPFIMVDRIIDNPVVQEKVVANVKGDNEGIGKATAERFIADGLQPGDKLYVMIGDTSSVPEMRNKGFTETLAANGWTEEQLATIEYSAATGWSRSTGKQLFIDWINSKTVEELGEYHYIFTHDDEIGMGILEALSGTEIEQAKKDAFLASVESIGSSSGLGEMYEVLSGTHANTAYPDIVANFDLFSVTYPPKMIQNAVDDMISHLNGEPGKKDHTITVDEVNPTKVADYGGFKTRASGGPRGRCAACGDRRSLKRVPDHETITDDRYHQTLLWRHRAGQGQLRRGGGGGTRTAGRKRRRQVHPDEHPGRRPPAGRRHRGVLREADGFHHSQIGGRGRDRLRPPGTERHQRPDRLRESVFEQGDPGQVPSPE